VKLRDATAQSAAELRLHYGNDFLVWKEALIHLLRQKISGIHLFRGEPGTGKTSFIRYLIRELKSSHRVYFLPSYEYSRVGNSALIDFFHEERDDNPGFHFVVIMEDAEAVLLPRRGGKDFSVSGLLNLSDGLLGEGLNLHILCTVNCELSELDPAVVRPGRLRSSREFRLLSYEEAVDLANYLKIPAPEQKREYSLAEIYQAEQQVRTGLEPKSIGFAAQG
jgi:SpoVK/Ycf46/Vps4 family AAA+-type ATPase